MSNMFSSRKVPLAIAASIVGGIFYMTYGANQQPRQRAMHNANTQAPVSETLQRAAGSGGQRAREEGESPADTRLYSKDPSAPSKI